MSSGLKSARPSARAHHLLLFALIAAFACMTLRPSAAEEIPDGPIDPNNGEQSLLNVVNGIPVNLIQNALNNYPVPYVVYVSAGGADPVAANNKAGSPTRLDADSSKSTGQGNSGHDLIVEVNTVLVPTPGLHLSVQRLGNAPFADALTVVVAFPFSAFGTEVDNGPSPNLFLGYQTTAAFDGAVYPAGGHAPQRVDFFITPGLLAGTDHSFDITIDTVGAANPIRFLAGHFEASPGGALEDAIAMGILTDPVPANIQLGITTAASLPGAGNTTASFGVDWAASAPTKVVFDYIEAEDFPFPVADFGTTIIFNQMPTLQSVDVDVDFPNQTIGLEMSGNAAIGQVTVAHRRSDGLDVLLEAQQVPTFVRVDLDLNGSVEIDVNANTMDFELTATQEGGFPGSDGIFGYPMEFFYVAARDVPDTLATWTTNEFNVAALNPGEFIGSLAFVIDDDARAIDDPQVELPPDQTGVTIGVGIPWANPNRHIFSIVDDGTHGTVGGRLLQVKSASLDFSAPSLSDIQSIYELDLAEPARPLTAFVDLGEESNLSDDPIQATCNIHDFPYGVTTFTLEFPPPTVKIGYETNPPQGIDEVHCFGYVGTLNFDLLGADLPPTLEFEFDPGGSLSLIAEDGFGGQDTVGVLAVRLWDSVGENGLGAGTTGLFGEVLRDARFRLDQSPSFNAAWANTAASTTIDYDTVGNAFLGGAQVAVSTTVEFGTALGPPGTQPHYLHFLDDGEGAKKHLQAGIFGLDSFNYTSNQAGSSRSLAVAFNSAAARPLLGTFKSPFDGQYFADYQLDLELNVDAVPATWDLSTDFATSFQYNGSSGIDEIALEGTIGEKDGDDIHVTNIDFLIEDAPSSVTYQLNAAINGSATLAMSNPISLVRAELWSDTKVLKQDYRHILIDISDIPAGWTLEWGVSNPNPHASLTTTSPLGPVYVVLSKDTKDQTPGKYDVFEQPLGNVQYSPFTREIDRRYFRLGQGSADDREEQLLGRIDGIHGATFQFSEGQDHLIMLKTEGETSFISIQGTGFQCAAAQLGPGSTQCLAKTVNAGEVNVSIGLPVPGAHPFFVGIQNSDTEFMVVDVPNIPDSASAVVGTTRAHLDFGGSPGTITVYQGPLPGALDGHNVLKLQLVDTPSFVHADWDLGFPGGVTIDTSNPLEVRLLSQSPATRTVAAFRVGDLSAEWGIQAITTDEKCQLDPPGCGIYLQFAKVFFEFQATPALDGFIQSYVRIGNPAALDGDSPPRQDAEYVPRLSFLLEGFSHFAASVQIESCIFGVCIPGLFPNVDIDQNLLGAFNVDWWDLGDDDHSFFGGHDYIDNDPWDLWPVFHAQANHVFPFRP